MPCVASCRSPYGERGLKFETARRNHMHRLSLSLRRAWIEIRCTRTMDCCSRSLSLRRAWIEIGWSARGHSRRRSLSLRRAWIEIMSATASHPTTPSRSPYGERGLKYHGLPWHDRFGASLSLRRAWIEIPYLGTYSCWKLVALLTESVD